MTIKSDKIFYCALLSAAIILVMLAAAYFCRSITHASLIFTIAIILFEIVVPIEILRYFKIKAKDFNIYAHNIDTLIDLCLPPYGIKKVHPDFIAIAHEVLIFAKVSLFVLAPYIILYWAFFKLHALAMGVHLVLSINFPPQIFYEVITQIFVVALPEELFYRGFLQSALLKKWPHQKFLGTNIIFALGHVVSSWSFERLLTFFPGIIFSYLVYKNKSILSAILFHATCNIIGQILYSSFFLQ
jgi:membrane protease YdiL (CAAX protease family)